MLNRRAGYLSRIAAALLAVTLMGGTITEIKADPVVTVTDSSTAAAEEADSSDTDIDTDSNNTNDEDTASDDEDTVTSSTVDKAAKTAAKAAWSAIAHQPASTTLTPDEGKWVKKGTKWKFKTKKGSYVKSAFYKIEDTWYRFDKNGYVVTGWFKVNGKKYYAYKKAAANGVYGDIAVGWNVIGKYTYYFAESTQKGQAGICSLGWQKINDKIYYFGTRGRLTTGLTTIDDKTFCFTKVGAPGTKGALITGWYADGDVRYYFRRTGALGTIGAAYQNTWATISNQKYYFSAVGTVTAATASREDFIETIGNLARADMKRSGVLASITVAQAILESGYGTSELALNACNLFGMKGTLSGNTWASAWDGRVYSKKTLEYENGKYITITAEFRQYASFAASVADHSAYLTGATKGAGELRYAGLAGCKKYKKAAQIIKNGGYATDPNYVSKLCSIIEAYDLTQYDK